MKEIRFCDIEDIKLGHCHNEKGGTGCSVVICEKGATGGVDVRGGSPGTRETDLLNPSEMVDKINAVKNTRIETVDGDEISRPGPRIDEGLKDLRDDIYKK